MTQQEEIARRLEETRELRGFDSLRAFRKRLVDKGDTEASYTAVRTYHDPGGRLAPVTYLTAVSRVFGVRLEWLVTGTGGRTPEEDATERWVRDRLAEMEERHEGFGRLPPGAREDFLDLLLAYQSQVEAGQYLADTEGADAVLEGLESDLLTLATLPLEAWGFRSLEDLKGRDARIYFSAILTALLVAVRSRGEGESLEGRPGSLAPTVRRLLAGEDTEPTDEEQQLAADVQARLRERKEEDLDHLDEWTPEGVLNRTEEE